MWKFRQQYMNVEETRNHESKNAQRIWKADMNALMRQAQKMQDDMKAKQELYVYLLHRLRSRWYGRSSHDGKSSAKVHHH